MIVERVSVDGADLALRRWGDQGPTIVALHPGVGDSRIWQWCAPAWAAAGSRAVAYDRRGFGETHHEPAAHDDLDDLRAVMAATHAAPAVIVGNSIGGGLAVDLALSSPDAVSALVLIAPSISGSDDHHWPTTPAEVAQDRLIAAAEAAGDLERVNELEVRYWLDGVDQPEGRAGAAARDLMIDMNGRALRAEPVGERRGAPPAWGRLGAIEVPVLVVVGALDLPAIRAQCRQITDAIATARLVTIADAAHCPSVDAPDEVNAVVLEFLGS